MKKYVCIDESFQWCSKIHHTEKEARECRILRHSRVFIVTDLASPVIYAIPDVWRAYNELLQNSSK